MESSANNMDKQLCGAWKFSWRTIIRD